MNWLSFFNDTKQQPQHSFGRGINAEISPQEEELFNKSNESFEKKDNISAYKYFFDSLENFSKSISNTNIFYTHQDDKLNFTIYQGSAKILGFITNENLYAESIICKKSNATVSVKRHLLDRNYQLTYSYYFLDDEHIKIKLYLDNITMTPQKIFFPLREISLNADFDKEYVKNEFSIKIEDVSHLENVDDCELQIKYNFLQESINNTIQKIETLPTNDNSGMQSFLLLNTLYMIDYLLVPKYNIYQQSSKKVLEYFADQSSAIESKNNELLEYLLELKNISYDEYTQNNYNAKYTFNPIEKTSKEDVDNFIRESLLKIRWYKNNRYNQVIPTIYKYVAFYILYNFGLNHILKELLHTLVEIQNQHFFNALGYKELYDTTTKTFQKKMIIGRIENIISIHQSKYKLLKPFGEELNFSSLNEFSNSYYLQIQNLNFEEI